MNNFTRVLLIVGGIFLIGISIFAYLYIGFENVGKILFVVAPFMIGLLSLVIGIKPYGYMKGYEIKSDPDLLEIIPLPMGWGRYNPVGMPQLLLYKNKIAIKDRFYSGTGVGLPFEVNYVDIENIGFKRNWNYWFKFTLTVTARGDKTYKIDGLNSSAKNKIEEIVKSNAPSIAIH